MAEAWPVGLPFAALIEGYDERIPSNIVEKQTTAGTPLRFRRFTRPQRYPLTVALPFTKAQVATFQTFYETTLADGLKAFTVAHPRTEATLTFYFRAGQDVVIRPEGASDRWLATLPLEIEA